MSVGNAKVGIFDPESGDEVGITGGALNVHLDAPIDVSAVATEATLAKLTNVLYATEYGATYNYIMRYQRNTTNWEIQRETISTGLREYATDTTALATAWTDRATQTYGLAV